MSRNIEERLQPADVGWLAAAAAMFQARCKPMTFKTANIVCVAVGKDHMSTFQTALCMLIVIGFACAAFALNARF